MTHPIWPGGPDCGCGQEPYTSYHEGWADATDMERARLVAAVGELPQKRAWYWLGSKRVAFNDGVERAAVLALILDTEGGTE